jgi:EAL domain-containing protein (putative c-di-GMP-specific phosphodiesterase class I)
MRAGRNQHAWGQSIDVCSREPGVSRLPRRFGRVVTLAQRCEPRGDAAAPALDTVLGGRRLEVLYQPILGRRVGPDGVGRWLVERAEALVRARDAVTTLRPAQFLPAIERAGLMPSLFQYVLAEALSALLEWQRDYGLSVGIGVNLHSAALADEQLPDLLAGLLAVAGVAPSRLTLELTETAPIADLRQAARNLERLRRVGVRVALDDFGAGFSTSTRLSWLECDELKIDRALVFGLEHSEEQRCVVEHLIAVAHDRGMTACAEGVESRATLRLLGAFGCDRAQGFLVARPVSAPTFVARVRDWYARPELTVITGDHQLPLPGFAGVGAGGERDAVA